MTDDHNEKQQEGKHTRGSDKEREIRSVFDTGIPRSLEDLAAAINKEHRACEGAMLSTLEHAWKAGQMLLYAKIDVPHGEWNTWLKENFEGSIRTAQGYVRVFRQWDELQKTQRVADLSLRGALKELSEPSTKAASPPWKHASPPWKHASPEGIPVEIKQDEWGASAVSAKPVPIETAGLREENERLKERIERDRADYAAYISDLKQRHLIPETPELGDIINPPEDSEEAERIGEAWQRAFEEYDLKGRRHQRRMLIHRLRAIAPGLGQFSPEEVAESAADELKANVEKPDSLLRDMERITNWVDVFMTELRLRTGGPAGEEGEE